MATRGLCPPLRWNDDRCNEQDRRDRDHVSGLRRAEEDLERFGATHDLVVLGQLLQQQTVVGRAGGQDIVGQIGQGVRVLLLLPPTQELLILLQHLLVKSHVLLLGTGQLAAASLLRIGQLVGRLATRLATNQRTYTHDAPRCRCAVVSSNGTPGPRLKTVRARSRSDPYIPHAVATLVLPVSLVFPLSIGARSAVAQVGLTNSLDSADSLCRREGGRSRPIV